MPCSPRLSHPCTRPRCDWLRFTGLVIAITLCAGSVAHATELDDTRELFQTGRYQQCITVTQQALDARRYGEDWPVLHVKSQLMLGRHDEARAATTASLKRYPWSIRLRLMSRQMFHKAGQQEQAQAELAEIRRLILRFPWRYTDTANLVACGDALLQLEAEPRDVLLNFYDRAKKENPNRPEAYVAIGNLALEKHDDALAAEEFRAAVKQFPDDPDVQFGLARALASSDSQAAQQALDRALEINPQHVPSLLFTVDRLIDAERYDDAEATIRLVLEINPLQSQAWAYRAVLAHYASDPKGEQAYRAAARGRAVNEPSIDYLIGKKLSRNYRFREGAAYQRRALEQDAGFAPATIQLAQDLLRLGAEEEGWQLAQAGFKRDGYDVVSFNLITLQENLAKFRTLEDDDFIVRMDAREAAVYGPRVLQLLQRAKQTLCEKYDLQLSAPVIVEIFPDQSDFAVRTFGMPGGAGYLGVCFGNVITANSPASQAGNPTNWESVLWHEFCHTVTLNLTNNKMPRWLSEGISVYEERQADGRWGQSMTPQYRKWILDDKLTPVSQLSSAFMSPPSGMHLQFAYFQSSLVVEHLIEKHGLDTLRLILHDLGAGVPVNVALERRTEGLAKLENDFAKFARQRAKAIGPDVDWTEPRRDETGIIEADAADPLDSNNIAVLTEHAKTLLAAEQWESAKQPLQKLLELLPEDISSGNAYVLLATAHRQLGETDLETAVLEKLAARSPDALPVYLRLLTLAVERQDWKAVEINANRIISVNPLLPRAYNAWARACRELGKPVAAVAAYQAVLELEPHVAIDAHYQLARLLHKNDPLSAKNHLLRALEEAPRFREAHRLLLKIHREQKSDEPQESAEPIETKAD
ncbi:tetratricopeptide repeat protein [Symmachiella dynata]|uniref:tetratricopeptide repeat protein n=1 Tax=Symmachiella dynata TaxID=2527995 RepID=UPI0030EED3CC